MRTFTHTVDALSQHAIAADVTFRRAWVRQSVTSANDVNCSLWGIDPLGNIDANPYTLRPEEEKPVLPPYNRQPFQAGQTMFMAQAASGTVTLEMLYEDDVAAIAGSPTR